MATPDLASIRQQVEQLVRAGNVKALRVVRDQLQDAVDRKDAVARQARWMGDPAGWVDQRIRQFIWSKQQTIMEAVRDHRRTAVRSCHGVGKSHIAASVAAWWLDTHPPGSAFVVTTAPTFPQVRAILWRYIRRLHKAAALPGRVNQTEWHLDGELVAFGRKPSDHDEAAFQGIHAEHVLVILDEACGIPPELWVAADALTTNEGCRLLAIGNPDNPASEFERVCRPGSGWHVVHISAFHSPNFTGEQVPDKLRKVLISQAWAEEKRVEWGEDSALYKSKVLGQFSEDAPNQVVSTADVLACSLPVPRAREELVPVELGVDVGGGGDETVIRERRGIKAGKQWTERSERPETISRLVLHAIRETGATSVKVDAIGVGWGVCGELRNMAAAGDHSAKVHAVKVSEAAYDDKTYGNLRAQMWWELGRVASQRREWDLHGMADADRTLGQLCAPLWHLDTKGRIMIEKKEDIIERIGRSPDQADALLLAFHVPRNSAQDYWTALAEGRLRR